MLSYFVKYRTTILMNLFVAHAPIEVATLDLTLLKKARGLK